MNRRYRSWGLLVLLLLFTYFLFSNIFKWTSILDMEEEERARQLRIQLESLKQKNQELTKELEEWKMDKMGLSDEYEHLRGFRQQMINKMHGREGWMMDVGHSSEYTELLETIQEEAQRNRLSLRAYSKIVLDAVQPKSVGRGGGCKSRYSRTEGTPNGYQLLLPTALKDCERVRSFLCFLSSL